MNRFTTRAIAKSASRIPGLRRLPVVKLLFLGELALVARDHYGRLTPEERRRLVALVREGKGRSSNLSAQDREELATLVAKVEPRRFAGLAVDRLSPVPLPRRMVYGAGKK